MSMKVCAPAWEWACVDMCMCVWRVQTWVPAFLSSLSYYLQFPDAVLRLWNLAVKQISVYPDKYMLSVVMTWEISIFFVLLLPGGSRFFSEMGRQLTEGHQVALQRKPFCWNCTVSWRHSAPSALRPGFNWERYQHFSVRLLWFGDV